MTHASLFTGIGGFDYAASKCGFRNIFQVEIDKFCQQVLEKNFPNVKKYYDIKEFDGTQYRGTIDILTGGFPCQPFSVAGKRKGNQDDRALFPEMVRVISEIKPKWIVAENVSGILSIHNGDYFEEIITSLESQDYEVQPIIIPASAVNAPHRRDRVWIIAHNNQNSESIYTEYDGEEQHYKESTVTNTERGKFRGLSNEAKEERTRCSDELFRDQFRLQWLQVATDFCRMDDGISKELYKLETSDRAKRLQSLGNAIVPQVAIVIFKTIEKLYEEYGELLTSREILFRISGF